MYMRVYVRSPCYMHAFTLGVCMTMRSDCSCQRVNVHENFRSKIKAMCVTYDKDNRSLIVLVSLSYLASFTLWELGVCGFAGAR